MGRIPSYQIRCESSRFWLKGGIERLSGLIGYSGIAAAVIFAAVGIAHAKNNKSTVGMVRLLNLRGWHQSCARLKRVLFQLLCRIPSVFPMLLVLYQPLYLVAHSKLRITPFSPHRLPLIVEPASPAMCHKMDGQTARHKSEASIRHHWVAILCFSLSIQPIVLTPPAQLTRLAASSCRPIRSSSSALISASRSTLPIHWALQA